MSPGGGLMHLVTEFLALKSRRIIRQAALGLAAGLLVVAFLGITLTFACIGLFLALEPSLGGPGAALAVAGISLVLALVILLAIFVAMRRRRRPRRRPGPVRPDHRRRRPDRHPASAAFRLPPRQVF